MIPLSMMDVEKGLMQNVLKITLLKNYMKKDVDQFVGHGQCLICPCVTQVKLLIMRPNVQNL